METTVSRSRYPRRKRRTLPALFAVIALTSAGAASSDITKGTMSNVEENRERFALTADDGLPSMSLNAEDATPVLSTGPVDAPTSATIATNQMGALLYDASASSLTLHMADGTARTIEGVDLDGWRRLRVFVVDHSGLGTGPVAEQSENRLLLAFPGETDSTLQLDTAANQVFVQPAAAKGFATSLDNLQAMTFALSEGTLTLELGIAGETVEARLGPMTPAMWRIIERFAAETTLARVALRKS